MSMQSRSKVVLMLKILSVGPRRKNISHHAGYAEGLMASAKPSPESLILCQDIQAAFGILIIVDIERDIEAAERTVKDSEADSEPFR